MPTSQIPAPSGSHHPPPGGEGERKEEEEDSSSTVKAQKKHHHHHHHHDDEIRSSSTPGVDPPLETSHATATAAAGASRSLDLATPAPPSPLTHRSSEPSAPSSSQAGGDEPLNPDVRRRDAGLPRASASGDGSPVVSVGGGGGGPDRLERRESRFSADERGRDGGGLVHHHHHYLQHYRYRDSAPTSGRRRFVVLREGSEARDDDDDDAAPPHPDPQPHLQLRQRTPQRRDRVDLSPPPPQLQSPNTSAPASVVVVGGVGVGGVEGATTGHHRSASAPVLKPLKSAFAAPKSPPLACRSPSSSETGGSGATSPSAGGMKKRARFEDGDRGLEGGGGSGRGEGELMVGRGLGDAGRVGFLGDDGNEEVGSAGGGLGREGDDGEEIGLSASSQDEVEDDDEAGLGVDAGDREIVRPREISSDESLRDVLQAEADDAADECLEDVADREDSSMGERDSNRGEDDVRDDEERSLDLRDDIADPLQDSAYDQEGSDQEDEGISRFALAEHGQATDESRTGSFDNEYQLNANVGLNHQSSELRPLASIDESKATQRARLPSFSRPRKPANLRRLSDSQAERDVRDAWNAPRRASSMGDFNRLQGRPPLRPLPAKAAPAGVALTATSVHPATPHKINPIYQHPNARWRHDVYDSRQPTRTEQTVYSGSTKYQILWEEPPPSDTESDTTLMIEDIETPQVIEPDRDSILAHLSRSPSPMGKVRTKLAAWSWAKEQEQLGMGHEEEEEDEAGATCRLLLLSTKRRRSPIEGATGTESPLAPPNTVRSGASSAPRSAPHTPFLECRDEGGPCGIRVEGPEAFDPDTGHSVESQGEFLEEEDVGEEGEDEGAGPVIGLGSSSASSSWSNAAAAADMHRLLKPALSRVRSVTLPPSPATTTTTTLDYLSFPATASSSRLPGPSLLSSSILQQQHHHHHHHHNPSLSRHFSNLTPEEEARFRTHRDSVDIHHRRLNHEEKMNPHHLQEAPRDSFLITKSKYAARLLRPQNPYLPLQQQHQHPSLPSSPTHIHYSSFGGLSPILDASPPSSSETTTTTKQSAKAVPISSSAASKTPSGEVPVKVTVLEDDGNSSEDDESDSAAAHPDEHVGCAICAVERPRWFEARQQRRRRGMQV